MLSLAKLVVCDDFKFPINSFSNEFSLTSLFNCFLLKGLDCHNWFLAVVSEFIEDNLSTGNICQPDNVKSLGNGRSCPQAQTFMQVSMMYEFFVRVYLSHGDLNGGLLKAVQGIPEGLFEFATSKNNGQINYNGNHAYLLDCTTNASRTALISCTYENSGDGLYLYDHNTNSLMSVILLGHYFKPSLDYCTKVEEAWDSVSAITTNWQSVHVNGAGWIKGTSQMMSMMAYGVGMLDFCNGLPTPSPTQTPSTLFEERSTRQRPFTWLRSR